MEYIKIKERTDILRFGLLDMNDKPLVNNKGEEIYWEFDLSDIELPLKWNMVEYDHKKNIQWLKNQYIIIDKKENKQGKGILTQNDEDKMRVLKEFYDKEIKNLNKFLGDGGVEKFLYGRNPYWEMFEDIDSAIEQVLPKFEEAMGNITDKIKAKYQVKEDNVLE